VTIGLVGKPLQTARQLFRSCLVADAPAIRSSATWDRIGRPGMAWPINAVTFYMPCSFGLLCSRWSVATSSASLCE
jgi:hypothetical protein